MEIEAKARENFCRRWANRIGLQIHKSRARESFDNFGGYMIIERNRSLILSGERFELNLADVEKFLEDYERRISS